MNRVSNDRYRKSGAIRGRLRTMLDAAEGNVALLGLQRVPPDGPDLAVGAGQVLQVIDGLGEAEVVELVHVVDHEELSKG